MVLGSSIPTGATAEALRAFLHAPESSRRFRLLLPEFHGSVMLNEEPAPSSFSYGGNTFAERDARAASHVQTLLDQVVDVGNVILEGASARVEQGDIAFLFGSRSNRATQAFLEQWPTTLFRFEFAERWTVVCAGQRFSLDDPTILSPGLYEAADDYGVIARIRSSGHAPVFMIAGLGGRATEGCGLYFREHWGELDRAYGSQDFALVLRFPAPFEMGRVERVASASEFPVPGL
jgi:hypothetical protein